MSSVSAALPPFDVRHADARAAEPFESVMRALRLESGLSVEPQTRGMCGGCWLSWASVSDVPKSGPPWPGPPEAGPGWDFCTSDTPPVMRGQKSSSNPTEPETPTW